MSLSQRGSALIVGLIMLVLMMLLAVVSINMGRSSLQIVGNMQQLNQSVNAANGAIEDAISTTRLYDAPAAIFLFPCNGANTKCVDLDGDGTNDITVALTPTPVCITAQPILIDQLNLADPNQLGCVVTKNPSGIVGANDQASLCSNSLWDITAVADDAVTQSHVTVNEGVNVQVATDSINTVCPHP